MNLHHITSLQAIITLLQVTGGRLNFYEITNGGREGGVSALS